MPVLSACEKAELTDPKSVRIKIKKKNIVLFSQQGNPYLVRISLSLSHICIICSSSIILPWRQREREGALGKFCSPSSSNLTVTMDDNKLS